MPRGVILRVGHVVGRTDYDGDDDGRAITRGSGKCRDRARESGR